MEAHGQKNKNKEGILTTKLLVTRLEAPSLYLPDFSITVAATVKSFT